ncbi:DUF485 domain-containing protein [Actinacidiphila sp. ITFR-21]|uniref:DUF485 domain-containing protein n=1 Tax=Actinacidiphila sp. ITFR-21 TaxID=3075199 RepID=UPI00288B40BC|nr:DUF485 domain-containing protein [Streptomyces sp. ITFR-21]WNI18415.1 DUF485 domain-containing protein [Streptomyces sp. ITFR-21]
MDKHDGGDPGVLRVNDLWQDVGATGLWLPDQQAPERAPEAVREDPAAYGELWTVGDRSAVYLEVQHSEDFQHVRDRYRRFVFPAVAGFVGWYLLYVVAATTAPGLMGYRLAGELNVALAAGLAQFASTFLLTWAYARHARVHRDRAALDLRWTLATRTGQERVR